MARTQKDLQPIDAEIAATLAELVDQAGITRRILAERTGMSANRLGIILRQESPPTTVGELGAIAHAVGSSASDVLARAEQALSSKDDYDLVANKTITEFPDGNDADFESA